MLSPDSLPHTVKSAPNEAILPEIEGLLADGYSVTLTVRGESMNPFLVDRRDRVRLMPVSAAELKRGMVVLAGTGGGRFVLHRIVARQDRQRFTLMGDGVLRSTETVTAEDIYAKVTEVFRKGRRYRCGGWTWRLYSYLWRFFTPLRRSLLALWRRWPV